MTANREASSALSKAGRWLHDHPHADGYPINDMRHLLATIRQANRGRTPQLLRECRDVILLMVIESGRFEGGRPARAQAVARETLTKVEQWLDNLGLDAPSPLITERIEKAGL